MTAIMIVSGLLVAFLLVLMVRSSDNTTLVINSNFGAKSSNPKSVRQYTARKPNRRKGNKMSDWEFYDDMDNLIEDLLLIELLFDVIDGTDWEGDYDYYVDDVEYYANEHNIYVDDVLNEESVVENITSDTWENNESLEEGVNEESIVEEEEVSEEITNEEVSESPTFTEPTFTEPTFTEPKFEEPSYETPSYSSSSDDSYSSSSSSNDSSSSSSSWSSSSSDSYDSSSSSSSGGGFDD